MKELARRYAQALYGLDRDELALEASARALTGREELWSALISPAIRPAEKKAVLGRLPELKEHRTQRDFLNLLCDKGRMALLSEIVTAFRALALEEKNTAVCVMTCVRIPDEGRQRAIKDLLCRLHRKSAVELDIRLDPSLLGGFLLEIEGVRYDNSVRGKLSGLAHTLQAVR